MSVASIFRRGDGADEGGGGEIEGENVEEEEEWERVREARRG
jgi:hypothetical protein